MLIKKYSTSVCMLLYFLLNLTSTVPFNPSGESKLSEADSDVFCAIESFWGGGVVDPTWNCSIYLFTI